MTQMESHPSHHVLHFRKKNMEKGRMTFEYLYAVSRVNRYELAGRIGGQNRATHLDDIFS